MLEQNSNLVRQNLEKNNTELLTRSMKELNTNRVLKQTIEQQRSMIQHLKHLNENLYHHNVFLRGQFDDCVKQKSTHETMKKRSFSGDRSSLLSKIDNVRRKSKYDQNLAIKTNIKQQKENIE